MALLLMTAATMRAQQGFKNQSVSVFKNASAFFIKSGKVAAADKKWLWQSDSLPAMLEGTFWVNVPDNRLTSLKSSMEDKKEEDVVQSFTDMLDANDGKRVRMYFQYDTNKVEGKVQLIKMGKDKSYMYAVVNGSKTNIFSSDRIMQLHRLEFLDAPNFVRKWEKPTPTIRFEFENAKADQPLLLMYLQNNLSWNPEYKLELLDDKKGKLTMQAAVVNEAEDFETEELNLVAGVPNFKYATALHRFIKFLLPGVSDNELYAWELNTRGAPLSQSAVDNSILTNGAMLGNMQMYNDRIDVGNISIPNTTATTTSDNIDGASVEDLYYYTLKNIKLDRGERALYDVFTAEVPLEHIYESQLPENSIAYSTAYMVEKTTYKVAHNVKLKNTSPHTWTSGSVLVINNKDGKLSPISQDALKYTSVQEERLVYLTEAPDVSVRASEKELEHKIDEKKITRDRYTYYYDLITVEGEIELQNFKDKPIRLDVKRVINGELLETSDKWDSIRRPMVQFSYNPTQNVCWEMTLQAKEKKTVKYKYKMYVQRYSHYNN